MAVTFDNASTGNPDVWTDSVTWNHTCNGDFLVVFVPAYGVGQSCSFGGVSMVPIEIEKQTGAFQWLVAYRLHVPLSMRGVSLPIEVIINNNPWAVSGAAASFYGVDPLRCYLKAYKTHGADYGGTLNIPRSSGEMTVAACAQFAALDSANIGGSQTQRSYHEWTAFGIIGSVRVATSEVEANPFTSSSTGTRHIIMGLSLRPTGSTGVPPVPCTESFDTDLTTYTDTWVAAIDDAYLNDQGAIQPGQAGAAGCYYDGIHVLHETAHYLGLPRTHNYYSAAYKAWICAYNTDFGPSNWATPGWRIFSRGTLDLYRHYRSVALFDALYYHRNSAAYSGDSSPQNDLYPLAPEISSGIRELAYHLSSHINAAKGGHTPRTTRYNTCIDWAYDWLQFGCVDSGWAGINMQHGPFMYGLLVRSLIEDWQTSQDARLIPALEIVCDYLWDEGWMPRYRGFEYDLNPSSVSTYGQVAVTHGGTPLLNNLIGPMYAWLGLQTGNLRRIEQFDLIFGGAVVNAGGFWSGKEWCERHTWVFEGLRWRSQFYTGTRSPSIKRGAT